MYGKKKTSISDEKKALGSIEKAHRNVKTNPDVFTNFVAKFIVVSASLLIAAISVFAIMFAFFWRGPSDCEPSLNRATMASDLEFRLKGFTVFKVGNEGKLIEAAFFSAPGDIAENQAILLAHRNEAIEIHNYFVDQINRVEWDIPSVVESDAIEIVDKLTHALNSYQMRIDAAFAVSRGHSSDNENAYREKYNSVLEAWVFYRMTLQQLKFFLLQRVEHDSCNIVYTRRVTVPSEYNDKKAR